MTKKKVLFSHNPELEKMYAEGMKNRKPSECWCCGKKSKEVKFKTMPSLYRAFKEVQKEKGWDADTTITGLLANFCVKHGKKCPV